MSNIQQYQDEGTEDNKAISDALNAFVASGGKSLEPELKQDNEQAANTASADDNFVFAEHEIKAVNEAIKRGMHAYKIRVSVDENCILKAARAFLVFKKS